MPKKTTNASLPKKSCDFFFCPEKKISAFFLPPQNSQIRTTCKLGGHDLLKIFFFWRTNRHSLLYGVFSICRKIKLGYLFVEISHVGLAVTASWFPFFFLCTRMDTLKPEKVTRAECTRSPDCGKLLKGFNAEYFCPSDHFIVANSEELAQEELLAKMSTTCELCGKEAPLARWSWGSACFVRLEAVLLEGEKGKLEFHCPPWETSDKKDAIVWSLIRYRDVRENFLSLIATTTSLSREEFASLERPKEEKEKDRKNLEEKAAKERKEWDRRYEEGVEGVNVITAEMEERRKEKEAIFEREGSRNNFLGNKIPSRMGLIHRKLNGDKIEKEQAHQESHEVFSFSFSFSFSSTFSFSSSH